MNENMTIEEYLNSIPGGQSVLFDLIMAGDREEGEGLICDHLPGMRKIYDEIKEKLDEQIKKENSMT